MAAITARSLSIFGADGSGERYIAVLDDDVNCGNGAQAVHVQAGLRVNGLIDGSPKMVIVGRNRQHFDPIADALYAFNALDRMFDVAFQSGASDLPRT